MLDLRSHSTAGHRCKQGLDLNVSSATGFKEAEAKCAFWTTQNRPKLYAKLVAYHESFSKPNATWIPET